MRDSDVIFEWNAIPLGESRKRTAIFFAALVVIPTVVGFSFRSQRWAVFSLIFLLGSLNRFWIPQRIRVSNREIEISRWWIRTAKPLADFKRFVEHEGSVFLSPFPESNRLDPYRGLWVLTGEHAQEFKTLLEQSGIPRQSA